MPADLDSLYKLMLIECQRDRTKEQYQTLKRMFAWLAYSKRPLTLLEVSELVALTVGENESFDVEEELIGRSSRYVLVCGVGHFLLHILIIAESWI